MSITPNFLQKLEKHKLFRFFHRPLNFSTQTWAKGAKSGRDRLEPIPRIRNLAPGPPGGQILGLSWPGAPGRPEKKILRSIAKDRLID